jgi:hypothetical protein
VARDLASRISGPLMRIRSGEWVSEVSFPIRADYPGFATEPGAGPQDRRETATVGPSEELLAWSNQALTFAYRYAARVSNAEGLVEGRSDPIAVDATRWVPSPRRLPHSL